MDGGVQASDRRSASRWGGSRMADGVVTELELTIVLWFIIRYR